MFHTASSRTRPLTLLPRAHPANEVFVTGDFDDWKKTIQLEKENGVFKKTVDLPTGKHQYKVSLFRLQGGLPMTRGHQSLNY